MLGGTTRTAAELDLWHGMPVGGAFGMIRLADPVIGLAVLAVEEDNLREGNIDPGQSGVKGSGRI